eukprot:sb/3476168/
MPEYNSFNDPHLQQYYQRKFQEQPCQKRRSLPLGSGRPASRPSSVRSNRSVTNGGSGGGREYHVTVKTGDVKGAGTNARVSNGSTHLFNRGERERGIERDREIEREREKKRQTDRQTER